MKEFNRLLDSVQQSFQESLSLGQKIEEYQDYARRIHILGAELDRLTQLNRGLEEDNKTMRLKYSNSMNIEKREQEFNLLTVLMATEIESLRSRIEQRETTIDEMRKSILEPIRRV
jgi:flagellar biosynthesis chaperone FliJ